MDRARLTDVLLHAGWLLFFAGIPFSGLSAPGILLILIHWAVARPQLPPAALANPRTAAAVKWYRIAVFGLLAAYAAGLAVAASPVDALGAGLGNGLLLLFGAVYAFRPGSGESGLVAAVSCGSCRCPARCTRASASRSTWRAARV